MRKTYNQIGNGGGNFLAIVTLCAVMCVSASAFADWNVTQPELDGNGYLRGTFVSDSLKYEGTTFGTISGDYALLAASQGDDGTKIDLTDGQFTINISDILSTLGVTSARGFFASSLLDTLAPNGKADIASWILGLSDRIQYSVTGFDKTEYIAIQWGGEDDWFLIAGNKDGKTAAAGYVIDANGNVDFSEAKALATATPEPATLAVFGLGIAGLAALRRRKK